MAFNDHSQNFRQIRQLLFFTISKGPPFALNVIFQGKLEAKGGPFEKVKNKSGLIGLKFVSVDKMPKRNSGDDSSSLVQLELKPLISLKPGGESNKPFYVSIFVNIVAHTKYY